MPRKKLPAEVENPMPVETGDGFAPDGDLFGQESGYGFLLTERNGADEGSAASLRRNLPRPSRRKASRPAAMACSSAQMIFRRTRKVRAPMRTACRRMKPSRIWNPVPAATKTAV